MPASKNIVSSGFAERCVEVGGLARDIVALRDLRELVGVAADQDRVRHHAVAVRQRDAASLPGSPAIERTRCWL